MGIVTTGMHNTRYFGFIGKIIAFIYRESVNICAEGDAGPGFCAFKNSHSTASDDRFRRRISFSSFPDLRFSISYLITVPGERPHPK